MLDSLPKLNVYNDFILQDVIAINTPENISLRIFNIHNIKNVHHL